MNSSSVFVSLSQPDRQQVSGGMSVHPVPFPGCILYAPGYPKDNLVVPGPSTGLTE